MRQGRDRILCWQKNPRISKIGVVEVLKLDRILIYRIVLKFTKGTFGTLNVNYITITIHKFGCYIWKVVMILMFHMD